MWKDAHAQHHPVAALTLVHLSLSTPSCCSCSSVCQDTPCLTLSPLVPVPDAASLLARTLPIILYCRPCLELSVPLLPEQVGRKRTAEDYHRTAEENGWVPGAHEEEDSVQQTKDEPSERYKQNQQEALDQWIMWVLDSGDWLT